MGVTGGVSVPKTPQPSIPLTCVKDTATIVSVCQDAGWAVSPVGWLQASPGPLNCEVGLALRELCTCRT